MLTEHLIASTSSRFAKADTTHPKDASLFLCEFQPQCAVRQVLKKGATPTGCLAVSREHIFAAQGDKSVVHVYTRESGKLEEAVHLPEKVTSVCLGCEETVLICGTEKGRIILWETCTGRLITTAPHHLQPVTALAVDSISSFLLSGSADSNVHVWSLADLLSFAPTPSESGATRSPIRTLDLHNGEITALSIGHISSHANFAVTISKDRTAIVWDFHKGLMLRTYLLGDIPLALALDPADRAFYVSYEDGAIQMLDLYSPNTAIDSLWSSTVPTAPVQPPRSSRWSPQGQSFGAALTLSLSFDGTQVLSGHQAGRVVAWDTARGTPVPLAFSSPGPISNILFLRPNGLPETRPPTRKVHQVVKPKLDLGSSDNGFVPVNYTFTSQFVGRLPAFNVGGDPQFAFDETLSHQSFPDSILYQGIAELSSFNKQPNAHSTVNGAANSDFVSLEDPKPERQGKTQSLEERNLELKKQVRTLQRVQKATFAQLKGLRDERKEVLELQRKCDERDRRWKEMKRENMEGRHERRASSADLDMDDAG